MLDLLVKIGLGLILIDPKSKSYDFLLASIGLSEITFADPLVNRCLSDGLLFLKKLFTGEAGSLCFSLKSES